MRTPWASAVGRLRWWRITACGLSVHRGAAEGASLDWAQRLGFGVDAARIGFRAWCRRLETSQAERGTCIIGMDYKAGRIARIIWTCQTGAVGPTSLCSSHGINSSGCLDNSAQSRVLEVGCMEFSPHFPPPGGGIKKGAASRMPTLVMRP